jgi:hypothetical protein
VGHTGRDTAVMAVPMSVLSTGWEGTHWVISRGGAMGVRASGGGRWLARLLAGWLVGC